MPVRSGKQFHEIRWISLIPQGKRSQLQAGNPAFRTGSQQGNLIHIKLELHQVVQELGRFFMVEAQPVGTDLDHLLLNPQTR
jgi:hypothetical protein